MKKKIVEKQNDVLIMRVNREIKIAIMNRSKKLNLSVSEYIRALTFIDNRVKVFETLGVQGEFIKELDRKMNLGNEDKFKLVNKN